MTEGIIQQIQSSKYTRSESVDSLKIYSSFIQFQDD